MGGTALNEYGVFTNRATAAEYKDIVSELVDQASRTGLSIWVPSVFPTKESFGDIDLVLRSSDRNNHPQIKQWLVNSSAVHTNGNCVSFEYRGVQVDLVFSRVPEWTSRWMSWGDASNLVGRITRMFGYKFGMNGVVLAATDALPKDILVTETDFDVMLETFGFEVVNHFESPDDVYKWVVRSKYFDKAPFLYENRNAKDRIRDRKRGMYSSFLDLFDSDAVVCKPYDFATVKIAIDKELSDRYNLDEKVKAVVEEIEARNFYRSKINGTLISEWTGLTGKSLGDFKIYLDRNFSEELKQLPKESVRDFVVKAFLLMHQ